MAPVNEHETEDLFEDVSDSDDEPNPFTAAKKRIEKDRDFPSPEPEPEPVKPASYKKEAAKPEPVKPASEIPVSSSTQPEGDRPDEELWNNLISKEVKRPLDEVSASEEISAFTPSSDAPPDFGDLFEEEEISEEEPFDTSSQGKTLPPSGNIGVNKKAGSQKAETDQKAETEEDFEEHSEDEIEEELSEFEEVDSEEAEESVTSKPAGKPKKPAIPLVPRPWPKDDDDDGDDEHKTKKIPPQEDMDLTPMVDVTFLLLIFFMLTASFNVQKSIPTPKPDPKGKGAVQAIDIKDLEKDTIIVEITADNKIIIDDKEVGNVDDLAAEITRAGNGGEKTEVVIQPDPQALHEYTVKVIDASNEAGMQKIRLADANES